MSKHLLSQVPAINKILLLDEIKELMNTYTEVAIKSAIKQYIEEIKQAILNEELSEVPSLSKIVGEVARIVEKEDKNSLRRVINATGTILHTNLGRSLLSGAFRIPEIIKLSGGVPVEVGTTNKTHLKDYENAITEETGALLKVHTSNYKILGFTESVSNEEISYLARENELVSINDLGSGQFVDFSKFGLPYEPTVKEILDSGIDIVTFSGDKLLGGPQAGIIVGKKKYIEKMKKNQLTRALRVDKMTLASLEATLKLYLDEKDALEHIPTLHMISLSKERLFGKADVLKTKLSSLDFDIRIEEDKAEVGGGSYPASYLESVAVKLTHRKLHATEIERRLLEVEIPIITRIKDNSIILDMRTLRTREFDIVKAA